jgi:ABC-type antimicrobial peptide transport system permease subunit
VHELGVRIALGAAAGDVMRHVVGRGVRPVFIGSVIGAALAVVSARLISSLLFGITAWNPAVLLGVVVILMAVAVIAACIPGWRAARIDPVRAMAAE